jgi:hypothetical protein
LRQRLVGRSTRRGSVDDQTTLVARARVADDSAGFGELLEFLAEHGDGEPARRQLVINLNEVEC